MVTPPERLLPLLREPPELREAVLPLDREPPEDRGLTRAVDVERALPERVLPERAFGVLSSDDFRAFLAFVPLVPALPVVGRERFVVRALVERLPDLLPCFTAE